MMWRRVGTAVRWQPSTGAGWPGISVSNSQRQSGTVTNLPAAWNSNAMAPTVQAHLVASPDRFGTVVPVVVRPDPAGGYDVLGAAGAWWPCARRGSTRFRARSWTAGRRRPCAGPLPRPRTARRTLAVWEVPGLGFASACKYFDTRAALGRLLMNRLASLAECELEVWSEQKSPPHCRGGASRHLA